MSAKRSTFQGNPSAVADVLGQYCHGRDFLPKVAKLTKKHVDQHKAMLAQLEKLQPNMSFQKLKVMQAFRLLLQWRRATWPVDLEERHVAEWVTSHASRLRALCKKCAKAAKNLKARQRRQPAGVDGESANGDENEDVSEEDESSEEEPEANEDEPEASKSSGSRDPAQPVAPAYFYGYPTELKQAWRALSTTPHQKEFAAIFEKPGSEEADFVFAQWKTGDPVMIEDVTVEELRAMGNMKNHAARCRTGKLWTGVDTDKRELVIVTERNKEEGLKYRLVRDNPDNSDGKEQILQVLGKDFGKPDDKEAQAQALRCLQNVAEAIARGDVADTRAARIKARKEELAKAGVNTGKQQTQPKKKAKAEPAVAPAPAPEKRLAKRPASAPCPASPANAGLDAEEGCESEAETADSIMEFGHFDAGHDYGFSLSQLL